MFTPEQLRAFGRDGYLTVEGVLDERHQAMALARIEELLNEMPPPDGHTGPHAYWRVAADEPVLMRMLTQTPAFAYLASLLAPGQVDVRPSVQVAMTFPPFVHMPGTGHLDGLTPPEPDGRPGTFTVLAGLVLSDQSQDFSGNLVVWPGTHHHVAAHLREAGPDAIIKPGGIQPVDHSNPVQVRALPGDLLISHYLLPHNIGANTSRVIRKTLYFRIKAEGHNARWRECVTDPLLELPAVRAAMDEKTG